MLTKVLSGIYPQPGITHMPQKRQEQNRNSQRKYRARQAGRMKELEQEIACLQKRNAELEHRNENLKAKCIALIRIIRGENVTAQRGEI
jgi:predicted RNase H-like nuclease (RuvC/YqgF family)